MGCDGIKYDTVDQWNACLAVWGGSSIKDFMCGCRPGSEENPPIEDPDGSGGEIGPLIVMDGLLKDDGTLKTDYVGPGPFRPEDVGYSPLVLDPDARPVVPGEVVDNTIATGLFYAPNKVLAPFIRKVPKLYQTTVATALPWLFWAIVAWLLYRKAAR